MSFQKLLLVSAILLLWLPVTVRAQISEPSTIPSYLASRDDLAMKRSSLDRKLEALQGKIAAQNAQCSKVASNSQLVATCRSNQGIIMADIKTYKAGLKVYEDLLAAAENPSPHESLLLNQERIARDLEDAKERRGKAMLQKSRLESLMAKAAQGKKEDPNLDTEAFLKIIQGAPAGIERAQAALAKTETSIKNLEMRRQWTERAINNLDKAMKPDGKYNPKYDLGFGMVLGGAASANVQLLRAGHDSTIALGEDRFLPGDEIVTDPLGHVELSSLGAVNYVIRVGAGTRLKLEEDHKERGTVWSLKKGTIHCAPIVDSVRTPPARVRTLDSIVQGSPDSKFDVRINKKGETTIEVYQGRVEVQEPEKGTSYFVEAGV